MGLERGKHTYRNERVSSMLPRMSEVAHTSGDKIKTQCKISKMKFSTDKGEKMKCMSTNRE